MTLTLPKHLEEWALGEVAAGRARSIEDLVSDTLEARRRRAEALRFSLDEAIAEADRDGWIEGEAALAEMDTLVEALEREARETPAG